MLIRVSPSRLLAGLAVILALNVSALAAKKDYAVVDFQQAKMADANDAMAHLSRVST